MKYYSEELKTLFDTEEELKAAETNATAQENEAKKLAEECLTQFNLGIEYISNGINTLEKILDNEYASDKDIDKIAKHMFQSLVALMREFI